MSTIYPSLLHSQFQIRDLYDVSIIDPSTGIAPNAIPTTFEPILSAKIELVFAKQHSYFPIHPSTKPALYEKQVLVSFRQSQIDQIGIFRHYLSQQELLLAAETIETLLPKCTGQWMWWLKKKKGSLATRSLVIHPQKEMCYIIQPPTIGEGTSKKTKEAIAVPFNRYFPCSMVACKINRTTREKGLVQLSYTQENFDLFLHEITITTSHHCFPNLFATFQYEKRVPVESQTVIIKKMCVFEELLSDSSTLRFDRLSMTSQVYFVRQLIMDLLQLGTRIHGDLKLPNILFHQFSNGVVTVKLTDLGFSCTPSEEELNFVMEDGFYGCPEHTAPEAFEADPYSIDWNTAEVWALGCCLYNWIYGQVVPWGDFLSEWYYGKISPTLEHISTLKKYIETHVQLKQQESLSSPQSIAPQVMQICFAFLTIDPSKRISLSDALGHLFMPLSPSPTKIYKSMLSTSHSPP